jgi:peptidoglycan/xylan/chitin deacetylase (PgdA/CDA1 family)
MRNILSIDLESLPHLYEDSLKINKSGGTSSERKKLDDGYIPDVTKKILDLLDKYNQKITFFIPGEIYDWYPEAIEEIQKRGHEVAYHTHHHTIIKNSEVLQSELEKSTNFINQFKPIGFRAPYVFITEDPMKVLKKYGFKYSSSTYTEYKVTEIEGIDEIPVSTIRFRGKEETNVNLPQNLTVSLLSKKIPVGSGMFVAMLGSKISYIIDRLNREDKPAILFLHSWQIYKPKYLSGLGFKLKVLCKNPAFLPYTVDVLKNLENLLKKYNFVTFKKYYYE